MLGRALGVGPVHIQVFPAPISARELQVDEIDHAGLTGRGEIILRDQRVTQQCEASGLGIGQEGEGGAIEGGKGMARQGRKADCGTEAE